MRCSRCKLPSKVLSRFQGPEDRDWQVDLCQLCAIRAIHNSGRLPLWDKKTGEVALHRWRGGVPEWANTRPEGLPGTPRPTARRGIELLGRPHEERVVEQFEEVYYQTKLALLAQLNHLERRAPTSEIDAQLETGMEALGLYFLGRPVFITSKMREPGWFGMQIRTREVTAAPRRLNMTWSCEAAEDLIAFSSIDGGAEVVP